MDPKEKEKSRTTSEAEENTRQDENEFNEVRQRYKQLRLEQRKLMKNYLEQNGFTVRMPNARGQGGKGNPHYGRRKRQPLPEEYDLSNWMWMDVELGNMKYLVSLQTFDFDPNSQSYHVLMDRLGIYLYRNGSDRAPAALHHMLETGIDLPMDTDKLERLASILKLISQCRESMKQNKEYADLSSLYLAEEGLFELILDHDRPERRE